MKVRFCFKNWDLKTPLEEDTYLSNLHSGTVFEGEIDLGENKDTFHFDCLREELEKRNIPLFELFEIVDENPDLMGGRTR